MKRKNFKKYNDDYEDGLRQVSFNKVKQEKERKQVRNFRNALKSKNLDVLMNYDDR
jgi:hypothetical protein